jgi:hypothetical protein
MRSLTALLFITLSGLAAAQQPAREDSPYLQLLMREAKAASVSEATAAMIRPAEGPLKVFVYTPAQDQVQADFDGWLAEWNRAGGLKYGRVEAVPDASQADIILARIVTSLTTQSVPKDDSSVGDQGVMIDPVTGRTEHHVYSGPARTYYSAEVYCYVVARDANGLRVLWRAKDSVRIYHDKKVKGGNFKNLKGIKDSKSAGDRLRNKFFEMMRAGTKG